MADALSACRSCGVALVRGTLACPSCHTLVHSGALSGLAEQAERAEAMGDASAALAAWREAATLLPAGSVQLRQVHERISMLSKRLDGLVPPPTTTDAPKKRTGVWATLATGGVLLFKFKTVLLFALTKAKFLMLGLTKAPTFFSMLLAFWVYLTIWGWKFALGFVLSIYVHEMGHIAALRRYGVKATAPMFIPGFGAVVLVQQQFIDVREDARVGLAGPLWGLGAAVASLALAVVTGNPLFAAIARFGAWINLFNLLPIWQLDGGRGFRAVARRERWILAAVMAAMLFVSGEGLFLILALLAAGVAASTPAPEKSDGAIVLEFAGLLVALGLLCRIHVEGMP